MLFSFILQIFLNQIELKIPLETLPNNQISLLQYISENCEECEQMKPHFIEIKERLDDENYDMNLKTINCNKYECESRNITTYPSFILYDSEKEAHRTSGVQTYKQLTDFILENTSIDIETFTDIKKNEGVRILYERDFYKPFDGPWIILFYKKTGDFMREVFRQMAEEFSGKIHLGEISQRSARNIVKKHGIKEFPTIIGINDGLEIIYTGERNYKEVSEFSRNIIKPTFTEITWNDLKDKDSIKPIFIVLYKDISLANHYFKQKAHDYKMSTEIFRSNDNELFNKSGNSIPLENINLLKEEIFLTVYKNGIFHTYPGQLDNEGELIKWIFHSHFPHLTMLTDTNYVNILHGIKPIIMLTSPSNQYIEQFDEVAKVVNHGVPFINYLFTYLDTFKFDDFLPTILPEISAPAIILYNPETKKFYNKKVIFKTSETLFKGIISLIEDYSLNKLKPLRNIKPSKLKYYIFLSLITLIIGTIGIYKYRENKIKENLKYQI